METMEMSSYSVDTPDITTYEVKEEDPDSWTGYGVASLTSTFEGECDSIKSDLTDEEETNSSTLEPNLEDENPTVDEDQSSNNCRICGKFFEKAMNVRRHEKVAHKDILHDATPPKTNKNAVRCPMCQKDFARPANVQRHLRNVHHVDSPPATYQLPTSPFGVQTTSLNMEVKEEPLDEQCYLSNPYSAEIDADDIKTEPYDEFKMEDTNETSYVSDHTQSLATGNHQQKFACLACGKSYKSLDGLKAHCESRHPEELQNTETSPKAPILTRKTASNGKLSVVYQCGFCLLDFYHPEHLADHCQKEHNNILGSEPIGISDTTLKLSSPFTLKKRKGIQRKNKKASRSASKHLRHLWTDTKEEVNGVSISATSETRKSSRTASQLIAKCFVCVTCSKEFYKLDDCTSHIQEAHHRAKWHYLCPVTWCDYYSPVFNCLKGHILSHKNSLSAHEFGQLYNKGVLEKCILGPTDKHSSLHIKKEPLGQSASINQENLWYACPVMSCHFSAKFKRTIQSHVLTHRHLLTREEIKKYVKSDAIPCFLKADSDLPVSPKVEDDSEHMAGGKKMDIDPDEIKSVPQALKKKKKKKASVTLTATSKKKQTVTSKKKQTVKHKKIKINNHSVCPICGKEFSGPYASSQLQRHRTPMKFECLDCDKHFRFKSLLDEHVEIYHKEVVSRFRCPVPDCDVICTTRIKVLSHIHMKHAKMLSREDLQMYCKHKSYTSEEVPNPKYTKPVLGTGQILLPSGSQKNPCAKNAKPQLPKEQITDDQDTTALEQTTENEATTTLQQTTENEDTAILEQTAEEEDTTTLEQTAEEEDTTTLEQTAEEEVTDSTFKRICKVCSRIFTGPTCSSSLKHHKKLCHPKVFEKFVCPLSLCERTTSSKNVLRNHLQVHERNGDLQPDQLEAYLQELGCTNN